MLREEMLLHMASDFYNYYNILLIKAQYSPGGRSALQAVYVCLYVCICAFGGFPRLRVLQVMRVPSAEVCTFSSPLRDGVCVCWGVSQGECLGRCDFPNDKAP